VKLGRSVTAQFWKISADVHHYTDFNVAWAWKRYAFCGMPYSFILALHFIPTIHSVAACFCYSYVLLSSLLISVLQVRLICASLVDSTFLFIRMHGSDGKS